MGIIMRIFDKATTSPLLVDMPKPLKIALLPIVILAGLGFLLLSGL